MHASLFARFILIAGVSLGWLTGCSSTYPDSQGRTVTRSFHRGASSLTNEHGEIPKGRSMVEVTIDPEGNVLKALIVESSGNPEADGAALALFRSVKLPPPGGDVNVVQRIMVDLKGGRSVPIPMQPQWGNQLN